MAAIVRNITPRSEFSTTTLATISPSGSFDHYETSGSALEHESRITATGSDCDSDLVNDTRNISLESLTTHKGLIWHAQIFQDDYSNPRHCLPDGKLKPRRPLPQIKSKDFFGALVQQGPEWIYPGPLNDWSGLVDLHVIRITYKSRSGNLGKMLKARVWWDRNTADCKPPTFPTQASAVRVTLRAPTWTTKGWSSDSPGFMYWAMLQEGGNLTLYHGRKMLHAARTRTLSNLISLTPSECIATTAHYLCHRYSHAIQTPVDILTYHGSVLIEWNHGQFMSVFELSWLNGLGGYGGKSDWFVDRDENGGVLRAAMPDSFIFPWLSNRAEIRAFDLPYINMESFSKFIERFSGVGKGKRFIDPRCVQSAPVRIMARSQVDIMGYLFNYIERDGTYSEGRHDCQNFAVDFFSFLVGKNDIRPFHPVNRVLFKEHRHWFLYDPALY